MSITIQSANTNTKFEDYTPDELNRHMVMIIPPKNRQKITKTILVPLVGKEEADEMGSTLIGGELAFNFLKTNQTTFLTKYSKATNMRYKFDLSFGFTSSIYKYYMWMQRHPYDWEGHDMLVDLGDIWKELLNAQNGLEELDLDPVFSYPALLEFL